MVRPMENYTLIITEKPDAAKRIAQALDAKHAPTENRGRGTPYYTVKRDKNIIVVPALGHLYTVAQEKKGRGHYPVFSYKWIPRHLADKKAKHVRVVLETISKLAEKADAFIDACDYDIEGSLIGYNILKHACNKREDRAKRMKYSTLTQDELEKAYQRLQPHLDFALIESGMTRHEVDWLYGINLTRALTTAAKNATGRYATLSTGRVQGPTLKFIAEREEQIRTHVPTPYWQLQAKLRIGKQTFLAQYEKARIETQEEAQQILSECKGNDGQVTQVKTRILRQAPPVPFDLGTLQGEAYRLFGYMPHRTLQIAQQLYVSAIISYPRTSSQKLPSSIDYPAILRNLGRVPAYRNLIREILIRPDITPHQGSREDSAHPAIYPTGYLPKTATGQENRIFDLIVRRFLAVFGEPALKQKTLVTLGINKHRFHLA
jgi:DNA topoisomerase-1